MHQNQDVDMRDGGYVSWGDGGDLTFICNNGVDSSSFFNLNFLTPNPLSQYSLFHQTIPISPLSVLLLLCTNLNSLFNRLTFSAWISATCLILLILLHVACFFLILILSVISSCYKSWMSYRHVSRCSMWTNIWSSNMFGMVKKLRVSRSSISLSTWLVGCGS